MYCLTACITVRPYSKVSAPMAAEIFKCTEHSERLLRSAEVLDFEIPYTAAEIDAAKRLVVAKNGLVDAYVRPVPWARFGDDGRFGAEEHHSSRHRGVGMAKLFRPRAAPQGHPPRHCPTIAVRIR